MLKNILFISLVTFILLSGNKVHAQLEGLLQKAKDKAEKAIEKKVTNKDSSHKSKNNRTDGEFDFISGDSLIFAENFSKYAKGATATSIKTNGAAIVMTAESENGKWMLLRDKAIYKLTKPIRYPKRFTLEFDILASGDQIKDIAPLSFGFTPDNSVQDYTSNAGAYVELHYYDTNQVNVGNSNPKKYVNTTFDLTESLNHPIHVAMHVNGENMTVYLDKTKLVDTELFTPTAAKNFYITAPWEYENGAKVMISNIRIYGFSKNK
ncbi:hypothetical protein [Pedobacter sp. R20-19]|uniref:hypothetical protein n=1 Tax=Pedobacter sp. R20-19 TaxID=1270196 RepID=UPI0004933EE9|nr:hypothetical protein [Pedobacter sp. R20-19]